MPRSVWALSLLFVSFLLSSCDLPRPVKLRIVHDTLTIERDGRIPLVAEITYQNAARTREAVIWESSRPQVARVEASGTVLGVSEGEARVWARKYGLSAAVTVNVVGPASLVPAGMVRVHYHRDDDSYGGWGLHCWGAAVSTPTTWEAPLPFASRDSFGGYVDIPLQDVNDGLLFIAHKGEEKDGAVERTLPALSTNRELWLKEGRSEVWTARPSLLPEFTYAEMVSPREIRAVLSGEISLSVEELSFQDHSGVGAPVSAVRRQGREVRILLAQDVDLERNWLLGFGMGTQWARLSDALLDGRFSYEGNDLGARLRADGTAELKLWSPPATAVSVDVFSPENSEKRLGALPLVRGERGVWEAVLSPRAFGLRSLDGSFYRYNVTAYGNTAPALDPYARSMAAFDPSGRDTIGKAAFVDVGTSSPAGFAEDTLSNADIMRNRADVVAYEAHVRDFTSDPLSRVAPELRGTYLGFSEKIPYLKELGITHVQFLPLQNYFTVNESDRAFRGSDASSFNYNWGYDPHNYFTPEGWLASDARDPHVRVRELKSLVQALHQAGIGVIVDVVYNHAFKAEIFESVCPGCYFRKDGEGRISTASGAGPSLESRRVMVRKLIVDSLKHFQDEYHVNGFRFDLMGFLDTDTLRAVRRTLGPDAILHGEAWEFTDLPAGATTKSNLPEGAEIGAFSDTTRDSFAGRMEGKGFVQGITSGNDLVRSGIVGNLAGYQRDYDGNGLPDANMSDDSYVRFARSPLENLGFLTIHDGYTLWDKINLSWNGSVAERARLARMAYAMLLTSQGRVILHAGDEMARTKPLAAKDPYPGRAHTSPEVNEDPDLPGVRHFHENSFSSSDYTNMVRWSRLDSPVGRSLARYTRGLIALRRSEPLFRQDATGSVNATLRFLGDQEPRGTASASEYAGYRSFADVPSLTLNFVNGPALATLYLAGEIYPAGTEKNPAASRFAVEFDASGNGSLELARADIAAFDLAAWSDPANLQIKAVMAPGSWEVVPGSYSGMGNNTIRPKHILRDNSITVNLAVTDDAPGDAPVRERPVIAYELAGDAAKPLEADSWSPMGLLVQGTGPGRTTVRQRYVVIHNASVKEENVEIPAFGRPSDWTVLVDSDEVDFVRGVARPDVTLHYGMVSVPRQSTTILARRGQFR